MSANFYLTFINFGSTILFVKVLFDIEHLIKIIIFLDKGVYKLWQKKRELFPLTAIIFSQSSRNGFIPITIFSSGCDAITKLKKLDMMGEYNFPEGHKNKVEVILDPEKKTLKFIDTGLGMTADEVEKYITQIAFSGATQFLEQYKDKTEGDQIIGHFGLGFYSAFMVADEVTIDTLSYKEGAEPVH